MSDQASKLRSLHEGPVLVLPNVWDAASAALVVRAGATAVATTSGGLAWSLGYPDGERLPRAELLAAVRRIAATVEAPVSVDIESGYGAGPTEVAASVRAVAEAGAAGINLEDADPVSGRLRPIEEQLRRIGAARDGAAGAGVPGLFLNIRTDVYLRQIGAPEQRLGEVCQRADRYAKAGADGLFVPGLLDLATLAKLVAAVSLPVNAMAGPGGPSVAELAAVGVRRVSVGTALAQAAYGLVERAAQELLATGGYQELAQSPSYPELNALFPCVDRLC